MRTILFLIVIICGIIWVKPERHYETKHVLQICKDNEADVYLVTQLIVCLFSYSRFKDKLPPVLTTPLGMLADRVFVQEVNNHIIFWNKLTASNILIIKLDKLNNIYRDLDITTKMNHLNLDCTFNELIGINNMIVTPMANDVFKYFGNVLAEILGVGCEPTAMLNLNGLLVFKPLLDSKVTGITKRTPLKTLYLINDNIELGVRLGRKSLIIDAYAYWNLKYIFQDCSIIVITCSGYKVGTLAGDIAMKDVLVKATQSLLGKLTNDQQLSLFTRVFQAIALNCDVGSRLAIVFGDPDTPSIIEIQDINYAEHLKELHDSKLIVAEKLKDPTDV